MTAQNDAQPRDGSTDPGASTLADRAAAAARAELRGDRAGMLGALGRSTLLPLTRSRSVPDRWSFLHVGVEGFRSYQRLPSR